MFDSLPTIEWDNVNVLWSTDYWDGPLIGMAQYNKQEYWFDCIGEDYITGDGSKRIRTFVLYEPTEEQLKEHTYWHNEFVKFVKDDNGVKPQSEWDKFYKPYNEAKMKFQQFTPEQARFKAIE